MNKELPKWMHELAKEENNAEFSQLCHNYFKLAAMRVMQEIREKLKVPPEDIPMLTTSIFARLLNDGIYAVGAQINNGVNIYEIYSKEHMNNLIKVLNGEPLDILDRTDIDTDIHRGLEKFRDFIKKSAADFYIDDLSQS